MSTQPQPQQPSYRDPSVQETDSHFDTVYDLVQQACVDYAKAESMADPMDKGNMQEGIVATGAVAIVAYYEKHLTDPSG